MKSPDKFDKISRIARSRGFFWPSSEIYGGVSGFINWGPLGTIMKRKIEDKFRDLFLRRLGFYELESPIITTEEVFEASGHIDHFKEPMVECLECSKNFRADHRLQEKAKISSQETDRMALVEIEEQIRKNNIKCPECGGKFSKPKYFLTMFKTTIGPYSKSIGYGRPEAAQGIFVEFKRLYEQTREKLPIGFAQIGHALRNEISPRQGPIRLREFTIIDLELFFDPDNSRCPLLDKLGGETLNIVLAQTRLKGTESSIETSPRMAIERSIIKNEWQAYFMALAKQFVKSLGVPEDKQRFIEKHEWERAHYSIQGFDLEVYLDRWGWTEVAGFNYRSDYDLKGHMLGSGVDMHVFKMTETRKIIEVSLKPVISKIGPAFKDKSKEIIETISNLQPEQVEKSFQEKGFLQIGKFKILPEHICIVREEKEERGRRFVPHVIEPSFGSDRLAYAALEFAHSSREDRDILRLPRDIAPFQLTVLPLVSKDGLPEKSKGLFDLLIDKGFTVEFDESGSIGRRYARSDEAGTPLCLTVDYQTIEDETVTIRDRDSWKQVRANIDHLPSLLTDYFSSKIDFDDIGKSI